MKKISLIISIVLFVVSALFSQSCLPEGIKFRYQYQIDNFQNFYPGCTEIEGDVTIQQSYLNQKITNLEGINMITSIGGDLKIYSQAPDHPLLTSFSDLINLTTVGGSLFIRGCDVTDFSGLDNLTFVGGNLTIVLNKKLTGLNGLQNLTTINGDLSISGNPVLSNCEIQSMCDYLLNPKGVVNIHNNSLGCMNPPDIAKNCGINLQGLPFGDYYLFFQEEINSFKSDYQNCREIKGNMNIQGSDIVSLSGLNDLITIEKNLTIGNHDWGSPKLKSLKGLGNIASVGGTLSIGANFGLTNIEDLAGITSVGSDLIITRNYTLPNLNGLENITSVGGSLSISECDELKNLHGLTGLSSIGGSISISYNDALTNLLGIANIDSETITNLYITSNSLLATCEARSICNYLISPNGNIVIANNLVGCDTQEEVLDACDSAFCLSEGITFTSQEDIENFYIDYPGCNGIEGSVIINGTNIDDLSYLSTINSIGGNLEIYGNPVLTNLTGLENLSSIDGNLIIGSNLRDGNPKLTNLIGLENLSIIKGDLKIKNNAALSDCDAYGICNYLYIPNGIVEIDNNAAGCNSQSEVLAECASGIQYENQESLITLYPNPAQEAFTISNMSKINIEDVTVYNNLGQKVFSDNYRKEMINISSLKQGIYIVELKSDGFSIRKKLIINE